MRQHIQRMMLALLCTGIGACGGADDRALKKFDDVVARINQESDGAEYITSNALGLGMVRYRGSRVIADPDGRLRVDVKYCRYELSINFDNPEMSTVVDQEAVRRDEDCELADAIGLSVGRVKLQDIDPGEMEVLGFTAEGTIVGQLEAFALGVPVEEIDSLAASFAAVARCRDGADCVEYVDAGDQPSLYFPCSDRKSCEKTLDGLRSLVEFANDPTSETIFTALAERGFPKTSIKNDRAAKKAAARITGRLNLVGGFGFDLDTGEDITAKSTGVEYSTDEGLIFDTIYDIAPGNGQSGVTTSLGKAHVDILNLDLQSISEPIFDDANASSWFITLECKTKACVEGVAGDLSFKLNGWIVTCKDIDACRATTRDVRGVAAYAGSKVKRVKEKRADRDNKDATPLNRDAPRKMRRSADNLAAAIEGSELRLSVSEGPMRRIMRGSGAYVGGDFALIVERDVCVALLPVNRPQWTGCEMESLFHDYALRIKLAELDPDTIDQRSADTNAGESGRWLSASCAPASACAEIIIPADAHHSARLQTENLMRSFREDETAPFIRVPCRDEAACERAEKALRALVKEAKKRTPKKKRRRGGDLVGIWEMQSAHQTGWVTEFRANGKFVFTNPTSRTEGVYTAKDGQWTQRAPQFNFEDQGEYRFLDENTLELTGKYGVSVWKRQNS